MGIANANRYKVFKISRQRNGGGFRLHGPSPGRQLIEQHRPERLVLDAIEGMSAVTVQFVVRGRGDFTITVDSPKGGWLQAKRILP